MDEHLLQDLEDAYTNWEEAERQFAHETSVHAILDTLDPVHEKDEYKYQLLRLKYSPAYFSGHPACCGERLHPQPSFDSKQYEKAIQWLSVLGLFGYCSQ